MFKLFFGKTNKNSSVPNSKCNQTIIDIQESLTNINNNIEQIKENNYKESQINWKFILTTAPLYFSLLAFFAILIGAFKTHSYLNSIGYISVFSEIIGNPSALIGIVVAYSLMVFLLSIYFVLPFFNFIILNHGNQFFKNEEFNKTAIRKIELKMPRFIFENLVLYSMVPILLIFWIFLVILISVFQNISYGLLLHTVF